MANFLIPLVDFIKNNAGNTLLLFGGILALIFGKSVEILKNFTTTSITRFSAFADNIVTKSQESRGALDSITKGIKEYSKEFKNAPSFAALGARREGATLSRDEISAAAQARQRFATGGAATDKQRKADIVALQRVNQALDTNSTQYNQAKKVIETYTAANEKASVVAKAKAASVNIASSALKGLASAAALAATGVNILFSALAVGQLVGTLFDYDVLGNIKNLFKDISQAAKDLKTGLAGLSVSAAGGGASLADQIKRITDDEDVLKNLPDTISKVTRDVEELAVILSGSEDFRGGVSQQARAAITNEQLLLAAKQQRGTFELDLLTALREENAGEAEAAKTRLLILNNLIDRTTLYGQELSRVVGQLARLTGLSGEDVAKQFEEGALNVERLNDKLFIAGVLIKKVGNQFDVANLPEKALEAVEAQTLFNRTLRDANDGFQAGALNSDKLSAKIAGLGSQLIKIRSGGGFRRGGGRFGDLTGADLEAEIAKLRKIQVELKAVESTSKGIAKAFGSAFTALDTAPFTGLIDLSGQLARNSEEAKKNQADFLVATIEANQAAAETVRSLREGETATATINERASAFNLSVKAAAGSIIQYNQEALKTLDTEQKKAVQLENQLKALRAQLDIQQLTAALNKDKELNKQAQDIATRANNIFEKRLELTKLQQKVTADEVKAQEKLAQAAGNVVKLSRANQRAGMTAANAAREGARTTNQGSLETEIGVLESKAFKNSTVINEKKRALIELERQAANERFTEQKALIEFDLQTKLLNINAEKASTRQRIESLNKQRKDAVANQSQDLLLFDMQAKAAVTKLQNDKETLRQEGVIALKSADAKLIALDGEEALFRQQSELQIRQLEGFKSFSETVNAFIIGTGKKSPFVQAVAEILGVSQGAEARETFEANLANIPQVTTGNLDSAISAIQGNISGQQEIFNQRRQGIEKEIEASSALNLLKRNGIDTEIKDLKVLQKIERDILVKKQNAAIADLDNQIAIEKFKLSGLDGENFAAKQQATAAIADLERQRNDTLLTLKDRIDAIKRSEDLLAIAYDNSLAIVEQQLIGAFMNLNQQLINGTITMDSIGNTFRDMLGGMMRAIQQEVFATTIAKPVAAGISGLLRTIRRWRPRPPGWWRCNETRPSTRNARAWRVCHA